MLDSRRRVLNILLGAVGTLAATPLLLSGMQMSPQPIPSPHAPNPNFPPGLDGPDLRPSTGNKRTDPQIQGEIRANVLKLYQLAFELKEQTEKTDSSTTLSLNVVKTAQQIEKLAKQIRNLSRG
jgi:hypothetical protein